MINKETLIKITDNSGALKTKCIHLYGGFWKRHAKVGDIILTTIKNISKRKKVKKKELCFF